MSCINLVVQIYNTVFTTVLEILQVILGENHYLRSIARSIPTFRTGVMIIVYEICSPFL